MGPALWLSLGWLAGATQLDPALADYQWDTRPQAAWGAEALAGVGKFAGGARWWHAGSQQTVDPSSGEAADVGLSSLEAVSRVRVAQPWGAEVWADGSGGWLRVAYDPKEVTFDAGGTPVTVALEPIDTWTAALGLAVERPLPGGWSAGLEASHRWFDLDTAHRNGGTIEFRRERFSDWSARVALARRWGRS